MTYEIPDATEVGEDIFGYTYQDLLTAYAAGQIEMRDRAASVCDAMPAPLSCSRIEANLCDVVTMQCHECIRGLPLKEPK